MDAPPKLMVQQYFLFTRISHSPTSFSRSCITCSFFLPKRRNGFFAPTQVRRFISVYV
jgi:hypothetical protein